MMLKAILLAGLLTLVGIECAGAQPQSDAPLFDSWPLPLSRPDFQVDAVGAYSGLVDLNDLRNVDRFLQTITTFGSVLHAWNPSFDAESSALAISSRAVEEGVWDAILKPQLGAINLAYSVLPEDEATRFAGAMISGIGQLNPELKDVVVSELSSALGHGFEIPDWSAYGGDIKSLRAAQKTYFEGASNISGVPTGTLLAGTGIPPSLLEPWMTEPYRDYRNALFGPDSLFEKVTGFAAAGSLTADGGNAAAVPPGVAEGANANSAAAAASGEGGGAAPSKAMVDYAKCVRGCFEGAVAGIAIAEGLGVGKALWVDKALNGAAAAITFPVAAAGALGALYVCEQITCKQEKQKVEEALNKVNPGAAPTTPTEPKTPAPTQPKTPAPTPNEGSKPKNDDCTRMSSPSCNKNEPPPGSSKYSTPERCYDDPTLTGCSVYGKGTDCSQTTSGTKAFCGCVKETNDPLRCIDKLGPGTAPVANLIETAEAALAAISPVAGDVDVTEMGSDPSQSMSDREAQLEALLRGFELIQLDGFESIPNLNEAYFERLAGVMQNPILLDRLDPATLDKIREEMNRWAP